MRRRWLRVLAAAFLAAAALVLVSTQPAHAACEGDPPVPAAPGPYESRIISDGDPFEGKASIQSVYGTTPRVWNYDNGCSPGSGIMPSVGAGLANMGFEVSGALSGWTLALLEAVIAPTWAKPLDEPVASATTAVANGTWTPWLVLVMSLVAIVVLLRARDGRISGAITATAWALLVLVAVSWVVNYPTESVSSVDGAVQTAVVEIGSGFSGEETTGGNEQERALYAVDDQVGSVVYTVQYRMWLKAVFGDPDSSTARKYGAGVYRATHFSWGEWERYRTDPDGEGAELREEKQEEFEKLAEAIKNEDPVAYEYFTGGEWGSRLSSGALAVVVMIIICTFLLVSGLMVLAAFAMIRLLVPFTPALGVIFLLDVARERAIDVFRRVGGILVMGPVYFVASLVLLRFYGELLTADMAFLLRLAFIIALSVIAWRLLKPAASFTRIRVPGQRAIRRYVRTRWVSGSKPDAPSDSGTPPSSAGTAEARRRPVFSSDGVAQPPTPATTSAPGTFVERQRPEIVLLTADDRDASPPPRHRTDWATHSTDGPLPPRWAANERTASGRPVAVHEDPQPTLRPVAGVVAGAAGSGQVDDEVVSHRAARQTAARHPTVGRPVEPRGSAQVNEANLTFDEDGRRVFVVYTPDKAPG